jgi:acetone carboxylase, beta subunit
LAPNQGTSNGAVDLPVVPIFASDAGGTMTDLFIVDEEGNFSVGKAATTPHDESLGFWESLADAFKQWDIDLDERSQEILPNSQAAIYAGTTMLNVLLTGRGRRIGVITPKGFEDPTVWNIGTQGWIGFSFADTMHVVTHRFPPSLVERKLIKGVTERIDMHGEVVVPLYEHEVETAVRELLAKEVEAIAICLIYSYLNPVHERAVEEIARKVMAEVGVEVPLYSSYDVVPIMREAHRLNGTILQAYAADPVRSQLHMIEDRIQQNGYGNPLQTVTSFGGLVNIRYPRLVETAVSGPIGGMLGAKYLADVLGIENVVGTDLGGTSFDIGIIKGGVLPVKRESWLAQRLMNVPSISLDSVGAGAGQFVTMDPLRNRIEIGPDSAGSDPGPVCYDRGNEIPTVMDCNLILGVLNPDNYLGGKLTLNTEKARKNFTEQIADPLGISPEDAAEAVLKMLNIRARDFLTTNLKAGGFAPNDFYVLGYGGAGPMHLAGYTEGLDFKGVLTVPFAAGFSSFGCATLDYNHHYQRSTVLSLAPRASDEEKLALGKELNAIWEELTEQALSEMAAEGIAKEDITLQPTAFVRYGGQLDDLEVRLRSERASTPEDIDNLIDDFEEVYERVYTAIAKNADAGYQILEVGLISQSPTVKPQIKKYQLSSPKPEADTIKETRQVYFGGRWWDTTVYDMDLLKPGNRVSGPAIIEATNTTYVIPPDRETHLDEHAIWWLE